MSDPNIDFQFIRQFLQILLENIMAAVVAATRIAKPQYGGRLRIMITTDPFPVPTETVASELARFRADAKVQMTVVANWIPDSVWHDFAR